MKNNILDLIKSSANNEKDFLALNSIFSLYEQLQYATNINQMADDIYDWLNEEFSIDNVIFALLIIIFSYFYTAITIPTNKMAEDLKRSNGFVPGYKPGEETASFLDSVLSKITLPGSIFLALLSILPAIIVKFGVTQNWAMFYGGTSLIIMVGVAIDTLQQVNSYLLNRHYDGLMKTGNSNRKSSK